MAATRRGTGDREITFDLSTAATGGDPEQIDHFRSESLVDSSNPWRQEMEGSPDSGQEVKLFFFLPVPCALEALTVINLLV